nr:hypothetical protein [Tanacetum cinerariifolium]
ATISFPPKAKVERLLAMPTPSQSPLASLSPPSARERLARCTAPDASPLPPPLHMPPLVDRSSRYEIRESSTARPTGGEVGYGIRDTWVDPAEADPDSTYDLGRGVCTRVLDPGTSDAAIATGDDILETELPPRKKSCLFAIGSREVGYSIRDTWVDPAEAVPEIAPMTLGE